MGNIASIISSHNRSVLNQDINQEYGCNCRSRNECPLQNKCLTPKIVYRANVENDVNDEKKFYFGVSETPFKERFRNHKRDFKYDIYRNSTELSKYIWALKEEEKSFEIKWDILKTSNTKQRTSGQCNLCVEEKVETTLANNMNLLTIPLEFKRP